MPESRIPWDLYESHGPRPPRKPWLVRVFIALIIAGITITTLMGA